MRYVALLVLILFSAVVAGSSVSYEDIEGWASGYTTCPDVPVSLLYAIACVESSLLPGAVNEDSGAWGLFQFIDLTVGDIGNRLGYLFDPFVPSQATVAAKIYISWLMRVFGEDNLVYVLAAWHWGPTNMLELVNGSRKVIPFETVHFINKVYLALQGGVR